MIENEKQYWVTQDRVRTFSRLVDRMESGEARSIPDEDPAIRQAKVNAARSILQELRDEIQDWESRQRPNESNARQTA